MLTYKQMCDLVDAAEQADTFGQPHPLVLPGWFPAELRPDAEEWASKNGWAGVVYSPQPPRD